MFLIFENTALDKTLKTTKTELKCNIHHKVSMTNRMTHTQDYKRKYFQYCGSGKGGDAVDPIDVIVFLVSFLI